MRSAEFIRRKLCSNKSSYIVPFNPNYSKSNGGMALNVQRNIDAIGAQSYLLTQDEKIDKNDQCVSMGGFINSLSPASRALDLAKTNQLIPES